MPERPRNLIIVAATTWFGCCALYPIFTAGIAQVHTLLFLAATALMIAGLVVERVKMWRLEKRKGGANDPAE